jgi:hypothetical protein
MLWTSAHFLDVNRVCARREHVLSTAWGRRTYGVRMGRERVIDLFDDIAQEFVVREGVDRGRIFSSVGLRIRGKAFAFPVATGIIAKLPEHRVTAWEAGGRAERMVMRERAMREWIFVDEDAADLWPQIIEEAWAFVDGITP